jgi:ubiquinone/menaquinone biosynthesis C-methylase UbiE
MNAANDFVTGLLKVMNARTKSSASQPKLMIVPGNHDVDWRKSTSEERHDRFARFANAVYNNGAVLASKYHQEPNWPVCFDFGPEKNLFVYLLNSTCYGGTTHPILKSIYEAIRGKASQISGLTEEAFEAFGAEVRRDPGYVIESELEAMRVAMASVPPERTKIAVVHHNPNHVPSDDIDTYDTIVNSGPFKAALIEAGFDFVLHGHRHIFHCSVESQPATMFPNRRCYFVSADSLGCKEHAPFLELEIQQYEPLGNAARSFRVTEFSYTPPAYNAGRLRCERILTSTMGENVTEILTKPLTEADEPMKARWRNTISVLIPKLQRVQSELTDWKDESQWISDFHNQLDFYKRIWATAMYDRPITGNPNYQKYLREQYDERVARLRRLNQPHLFYSPEVHAAITRTAWRASDVLWGDRVPRKCDDGSELGLEIARIMVIDRRMLDAQVLRNLNHDHAFAAIPLFVIDREHVPAGSDIDFALGLNERGLPIKACAYDRTAGEVREMRPYDAHDLLSVFETLLSNPNLTTVDHYLGGSTIWKDPARSKALANLYAETRRPSRLILSVLSKHLPEQGEVGLDLCCGTGNYTFPFAKRFSRLIGLDESPEMLAKSEELHKNSAEWILGEAKATKIESGACDAVWMISALHYFRDEEQLLLFQEVFRILKPGGVFVADTEFLEQHASLWIVDYFPSLKERFRNRLYRISEYREWLEKVGFEGTLFEKYDYPSTEGDPFLRIGQNDPKVYLEERVQKGIPAFHDMNNSEKANGLRRLRAEIRTGEVLQIRKNYISRAEVKGDMGFIIARKPMPAPDQPFLPAEQGDAEVRS